MAWCQCLCGENSGYCSFPPSCLISGSALAGRVGGLGSCACALGACFSRFRPHPRGGEVSWVADLGPCALFPFSRFSFPAQAFSVPAPCTRGSGSIRGRPLLSQRADQRAHENRTVVRRLKGFSSTTSWTKRFATNGTRYEHDSNTITARRIPLGSSRGQEAPNVAQTETAQTSWALLERVRTGDIITTSDSRCLKAGATTRSGSWAQTIR
jgi:hypothetical protein